MRRLGDFILLEEIGRGGMGKVYHARQISLEREVALKVLPLAGGLDPDTVTRFRREAEAAGRLSHPGIVPIYAIGEVDDTYYYAMELVCGPSLAELIHLLRDRTPSTLRFSFLEETESYRRFPDIHEMPVPPFLANSVYAASCAAFIMDLCGALTAAHHGQVIHRDVKPSNILLHPAGRPVLVDFGLARDNLALSMTQTGEAVGTPAYMAPEQAAGSKMVDARVDVYGLGATLYELLTLQPPFGGESAAEVMRAILDDDPMPPRRLNPRVPRALETIVLTCLAKDTSRRYRTTAELGADLRAFLSGTEIRARRPSLAERISGNIQRNRRSAWVACLTILFVLVIGLSYGLVKMSNERQAGVNALENAKILLLQGRVRDAQAAYVEAQLKLEDPALVAERRLANFAEAFPAMYAKNRHDVLLQFLDTLPADDLDRPEYHEFRRRIRGIGHVGFVDGSRRGVQVHVLRIVDGEFKGKWRRMPADGWLTVGHYMLRCTMRGMAPVLRGVEVERDRKVTLDVQFKPASMVPAGMGFVSPDPNGALFAADLKEFTVGQYMDFLHSIDDPALRAELEPKDWAERHMNRPVTGLSFRQARTVVGLLGGHLMSRDEFVVSAICGASELQYPWGNEFDIQRVVGDSRFTSALAPVGSKPRGASPVGMLDLVGNAAEMLSAQRDGNLFCAGGHYASEPRDLSARSFSALLGPDDQNPFVGFRLARFLPFDDDGKANGNFESRIAALEKAHKQFVVSTWTIGVDGKVQLVQNFHIARGVQLLDFPELTGFRQTSGLAKDTSGNRLALHPNQIGGGHRLEVVDRPGPIRLTVHRRLSPVTGLRAERDAHVLRVPLPSRGRLSLHRVELPVGSFVDEVWPEPDDQFYLDGAPVLLWQRDVRIGAAGPTPHAVVRFRRDGVMTDRWPATAPTMKFITDFFDALKQRDASRLEKMLAEDCRFEPQGWRRDEVLRKLGALPVYEDVVVRDVTAVGDVVSVDLELRWHLPGGLREARSAADWPTRVVLRRMPDGMHVVRLMPAARRDLGRIEDGTYSHRRLRVELRPENGTEMFRRASGLGELQLELRPQATKLSLSDHWITLTGCTDGSGDATAVRMRLTDGEEGWRRGQRVAGDDTIAVGDGESAAKGANQHWMFRSRDGSVWSRERWTLLTQQDRHFLVRCVATGSSRADAETRFRAKDGWFRSVLTALKVY